MRGSPQGGHSIKKSISAVIFLGSDKIDVVGIGRKSQAEKYEFIRRYNLHVTAGSHLTNIQALLFAFNQSIDHIAPVWGNGDIKRIPALRDSPDRHTLRVPLAPAPAHPGKIDPDCNHQ